MFGAGMSPASTSERYASDSAMPSEIQRGPSMQALPPSSYCQRWMYSCAASSFRSVLGVQVSGAAAGGDDQARLDVTISYVTPDGDGGVGRGAEPSALSTVTIQKTP